MPWVALGQHRILTVRYSAQHPTPVLLPGKSHGWRSLEGCSPWGRWGSDTTERLPFHFSLSCIGEGNGNPLQCSCLENRRDRGAWWAAVYVVAQSWTWLKRLSSSSPLCGRSTDFCSPNTPSSPHPQASTLLLPLPDFSGPDLRTADSYLPFRSQIKCCLLWDAILDSKIVIFNILLLYFVFLLALIVSD